MTTMRDARERRGVARGREGRLEFAHTTGEIRIAGRGGLGRESPGTRAGVGGPREPAAPPKRTGET